MKTIVEHPLNVIFIITSLLLFFSIISSRLFEKTGIPTLFIFIAIGITVGSDGFNVINFNDYNGAQIFGTISISIILFYGGLDTDIRKIRHLVVDSICLATIGSFITSVVIGLFIHLIAKFSWAESLMVGAIISSTDAAAVFSTLKSKNISLKDNLSSVLEIESGSNDVVSYFLVSMCLLTIKNPQPIVLWKLLFVFCREMFLGAGFGFILGKLLVYVINNINLKSGSLYPGIPFSFVLFGFYFVEYIHGSGFLCVYIIGLFLGSENIIHKNSLKIFYESTTWLLEICLFVMLGLLVSLKNLLEVSFLGIVVSLLITLIARPIGVFTSLFFSKRINNRQKIFISWGSLRGAAPIIFAIYPLLNKIENANNIFHIVFFVVIFSVLLQATTLHKVAQFLNIIYDPEIESAETQDGANIMVEITIPIDSIIIGKRLVDIELPEGARVVSVYRENMYINPTGSFTINYRDILLITLLSKEDSTLLKANLDV